MGRTPKDVALWTGRAGSGRGPYRAPGQCRCPDVTLVDISDFNDLVGRLDAIEARAAAATPGPWDSFVEGRNHESGDDFIRRAGLDDDAPDMYVTLESHPAGQGDLDFIAHARQDLPYLVAVVGRLLRAPGLDEADT